MGHLPLGIGTQITHVGEFFNRGVLCYKILSEVIKTMKIIVKRPYFSIKNKLLNCHDTYKNNAIFYLFFCNKSEIIMTLITSNTPWQMKMTTSCYKLLIISRVSTGFQEIMLSKNIINCFLEL